MCRRGPAVEMREKPGRKGQDRFEKHGERVRQDQLMDGVDGMAIFQGISEILQAVSPADF